MPFRSKVSGPSALAADARTFHPGALCHYVNEADVAPWEGSHRSKTQEFNCDSSSSSDSLESRLHEFKRSRSFRGSSVGSFLPFLLDEFVQPMWREIDVGKRSSPSILPNVSCFPVVAVPLCWSGPASYGGLVLCRSFTGNWTLVDVDHIRQLNVSVRDLPLPLQKLLIYLNNFHSQGSVHVLFDDSTMVCYIIEVNMSKENILMTAYCRENGPSAINEISAVPLGAVNVCGVFEGVLFLSVGSVPYKVQGGIWTKVGDAISTAVSKKRTPISIQNVVPCVGKRGLVYYLSGGVLMSASKDGSTEQTFAHENIAYISSSYDSRSQVIVLVGYDTRENVDTQYITLFDLPGSFVISTQAVDHPPQMSLISCAIDPATSDVVIVGRGGDTGRHGAICYSLPAVYN